MVRTRPQDRFDQLVRTAADVFIRRGGFGRTQMEDIAVAMGVAKGTLYGYVEGKEALFDLVVRHADDDRPVSTPDELPVKNPPAGAILDYVRERLDEDTTLRTLGCLLTTRTSSKSAPEELEEIVSVLYRGQYENRRAIKAVDTSAADYPELAALWYTRARVHILELLIPFIERRQRDGVYRAELDPAIAARFVLETCVFWAIHRHWDPYPQMIDEKSVESTLLSIVTRGLLL